MSFVRPITLKNLKLSSNIWYAPLAGCSDWPFRKMSRKYKPGMMFTEMVKMDALVRQEAGTYDLLSYTADMHPMGTQLVGSKVNLAGPCARILEDLGFDLIDLNCGCPVDKVTKDCSGSGLLRNPKLIGDILHEMVNAVKVPVTVKIRIGWDDANINAVEIAQIAELAGACAITIHGRTRQQGYKGPADWTEIKKAKERTKNIKVFGNGDLFTAQDVALLFEETGCDGALISRGTLGAPWIAEDIYRLSAGLDPILRDGLFLKQTLLEHLSYIEQYVPERRALTDLRRVGCWYLKKEPHMKQLREEINSLDSLEQAYALIESYPWHTIKSLAPTTPGRALCPA